MKQRSFILSILVFLVSASLLSACSDGAETSEFELAPLADMPAEVQAAPFTVQQAYQFSLANPEIMTQIPCYCGCGSMGHTSNYACYVSGHDESGKPIFDNHALGCSICVDITLDSMRLLEDGKSVPDIRTYIDQTYSQFGPSNMP